MQQHKVDVIEKYECLQKAPKNLMWPASLAWLIKAYGFEHYQDFSRAVGISQSGISHYLTGFRFPRQTMMLKLTAFFGLDQSELLWLGEEKAEMILKKKQKCNKYLAKKGRQ